MSATVCWAVKGGSGTSVVAACSALTNPLTRLLVDLDGDQPSVLGLPEPAGQGLGDWFATDLAGRAIEDLGVELDATTRLVARGPSSPNGWRPRRSTSSSTPAPATCIRSWPPAAPARRSSSSSAPATSPSAWRRGPVPDRTVWC